MDWVSQRFPSTHYFAFESTSIGENGCLMIWFDTTQRVRHPACNDYFSIALPTRLQQARARFASTPQQKQTDLSANVLSVYRI